MTWRLTCQLPGPDTLSDLLASLDFLREQTSLYPLVQLYRHPDIGRLVIVPETNRIELRLNYLIPFERREDTARAFAGCFGRALLGSNPTWKRANSESPG